MKKEPGKSRLYLHLQTSMTSIPNANDSESSSSAHCSESSPADEPLGCDFEKLSMGFTKKNLDGQNVNLAQEKDRFRQAPPPWFLTYMEKMQESLRLLIHEEVQQCMRETLKDKLVWYPARMSQDSADLHEPQTQEVSEPSTSSVRPKKAVTTSAPLHLGITCDHCEQPVSGIRFKCGNCVDYDLCENCEGIAGVHQPDHVFLKIRRPTSLATCRQKGERRISLLRHMYPQLGQALAQGTGNECAFRSRKREKKVKRWLNHAENFFAGHLGQERRSHRPGLLSGSRGTTHSLTCTQAQLLYPRHSCGQSQSKPLGASMKCLTEISPASTIQVHPGQEFEKEWKVRNDSQEPFTSSYRLRFSWGSLMPKGQVEISVPSLWPGETGSIGPVRFRAPQQEGLYHSHWLLVSHPGGMPFPEPSLSCPVHVMRQKENTQEEPKEHDSAKVSRTVEETVSPNVSVLKNITVTVKNESECAVQRSSASNNNTTGPEESDDTASILSISSCDSDEDYVKVQGPNQLGFSTTTLLTKRQVSLQSAGNQGESQATSSSSIDLLSDMPYLEEETGQRQQPDMPSANVVTVVPNSRISSSVPSSIVPNMNESHFSTGSEVVSQETGAPEVAEFNSSQRNHVDSSSRSDRSQPSRPDPVNRQESVSVLPEGLVTGALTAAASVYNTARALISNLQPPIDARTNSQETQLQMGPPGPMTLLLDMGFHDRELNKRLLIEKGGRMEDVVAELLQRRPDHSLHID